MKWVIVLCLSLFSQFARGFCGFYVAKADAKLFNRASQVVYVRDGNKNALTLANDYQGELTSFALVVPVPEVLTREQINVGDKSLIEKVDAFTAPRLVEYHDPDPCNPPMYDLMASEPTGAAKASAGGSRRSRDDQLGVKIEAKYVVGEYDIVILSAKESGGLETWLKESGYKMPKNASKALEPYIKQNLKFFVAKVNLKEQAKTGFTYLRPLQFAFESPKFMLPVRLGMMNAEGPQDLVVYAITKKGRVETTNYRTVKIPSGGELPAYVKTKFADFYRAMFDTVYERENKRAVFLEHAWNMGWCDPCAADPIPAADLKKLGVFWLGKASSSNGGPIEAFVSRLHVRYDAKNFPEDLMFQQTTDEENFQGRYVLRHPWTGEMACEAAASYRDQVKVRRTKEAQTLASLTGWNIVDIHQQMGGDPAKETGNNGSPKKWYRNIFK